MRIDSTAVETDVHDPTDASLLWDGIRIITRYLEEGHTLDPRPDYRYSDHLRAAKKRLLAVTAWYRVLICGYCARRGERGRKAYSLVNTRFPGPVELAQEELGGNRFVDELDFHNVHDALRKHEPWRNFLSETAGESHSNTGYDKLYSFTKLRNAVMHGRLLFPTYQHFKDGTRAINTMMVLIENLSAYYSLR